MKYNIYTLSILYHSVRSYVPMLHRKRLLYNSTFDITCQFLSQKYSTCKMMQYSISKPNHRPKCLIRNTPGTSGRARLSLIAYLRYAGISSNPRPVVLYTFQACHALKSIQRIGCEQTLHVLPVVRPRSAAVVISHAPTVSTKGAAAHALHSSRYQMQAPEAASYLLLDPQL